MRFIIAFLCSLLFVICLNAGSACAAIMFSIGRPAPIATGLAVLMILGLVFVSLHALVTVGFSANTEPLNESGNLRFNSLTYGAGSCIVLLLPASFFLWVPAMSVVLEYFRMLPLVGTFLVIPAVWLSACFAGLYIVTGKFGHSK